MKKNVNEAKTEKELYVQYHQRECTGKYSCKTRMFQKEVESLESKLVVI